MAGEITDIFIDSFIVNATMEEAKEVDIGQGVLSVDVAEEE